MSGAKLRTFKFVKVITAVALILALLFLICACTEKPASDYTDLMRNNYEVEISDEDDGRLYSPQAKNVTWGFIFYLGTAMSTDNYDYIMTAIAKAGIAVYVPSNPFPDLLYSENEEGYFALDTQNYFIGGHSQGGGAAVRRACENPTSTRGVALYSPLISNDCTLSDKDMPTIYFEAENDKVLSSSMQSAAKNRMNKDCEFVTLRGAGHMCYGASSLLDGGGTTRDKAEIQAEVIQKTLSFMQSVINKTAAPQ